MPACTFQSKQKFVEGKTQGNKGNEDDSPCDDHHSVDTANHASDNVSEVSGSPNSQPN